MRMVIGGWLGGDPLPLERRLSVDGPGTLPGFDFRSGRDGSRRRHVQRRPRRCRAGRPSAIASRSRRSSIAAICRSTSSASGMTGRAAIAVRTVTQRGCCSPTRAADGKSARRTGESHVLARQCFPPLSTFRTDLGLGLDVSGIGVYAAKSVSTPAEPINFFVRLRHRF